MSLVLVSMYVNEDLSSPLSLSPALSLTSISPPPSYSFSILHLYQYTAFFLVREIINYLSPTSLHGLPRSSWLSLSLLLILVVIPSALFITWSTARPFGGNKSPINWTLRHTRSSSPELEMRRIRSDLFASNLLLILSNVFALGLGRGLWSCKDVFV